MSLTKEQFSEWRDNPATQDVLQALKNYARYSHQLWAARAWGVTYLSTEDQLSLADLKARSKLADEWSGLSFEAYEEFSKEERA